MKGIRAVPVAGVWVAALVLAAPVAAQDAPSRRPDPVAESAAPVARGDRVRIRAAPLGAGRYVAEVLAVRGDTLLLSLQARPANARTTTRVPVSTIRTLDVAMGTKSNAWHGAKIGGAVGGMVGLLVGLVAYGSEQSCSGFYCFDVGPEVIPLVTVGGALAGGLVGAAIGAGSRTDRWVPIAPERLAVAVEPRPGGAALVARVPLRF